MTHDELLVKIGNPIDEGYEYADIVFNKALRVVVEICKDAQNDIDVSGFAEGIMEAIEKELN